MLSTEGNGMEKGGDSAAMFATLIFTYFYSSVYRDLLLPSSIGKCAFH